MHSTITSRSSIRHVALACQLKALRAAQAKMDSMENDDLPKALRNIIKDIIIEAGKKVEPTTVVERTTYQRLEFSEGWHNHQKPRRWTPSLQN